MWRAALPCRRTGIALLGLTVVVATLAVASTPARSSAAQPAAAGQVWAVALPDSVKTVQRKELRWLSDRGITTIVAFGRSQRFLRKLADAAQGSRLFVIAPRRTRPVKPCKSSAGQVLRTCAVVVATPLAAVRLARRGLVDRPLAPPASRPYPLKLSPAAATLPGQQQQRGHCGFVRMSPSSILCGGVGSIEQQPVACAPLLADDRNRLDVGAAHPALDQQRSALMARFF